MDRLIYTSMTGAKHAFMQQQAGVAHNLANAKRPLATAHRSTSCAPSRSSATARRRAFLPSMRRWPTTSRPGRSRRPGGRSTSRSRGRLIAVEGRDGREAYTRAGNLEISNNYCRRLTDST